MVWSLPGSPGQLCHLSLWLRLVAIVSLHVFVCSIFGFYADQDDSVIVDMQDQNEVELIQYCWCEVIPQRDTVADITALGVPKGLVWSADTVQSRQCVCVYHAICDTLGVAQKPGCVSQVHQTMAWLNVHAGTITVCVHVWCVCVCACVCGVSLLQLSNNCWQRQLCLVLHLHHENLEVVLLWKQ